MACLLSQQAFLLELSPFAQERDLPCLGKDLPQPSNDCSLMPM